MANTFLGNNHSISLDEAKKMTKKFRAEKEKIVKEEHKDKHLLPYCESFDRKAFERLLRKENCAGIRIYYGMKEDKTVHAIVVPFDANGKDILPTSAAGIGDETDPEIINNSSRCPTQCPDASPLNTD